MRFGYGIQTPTCHCPHASRGAEVSIGESGRLEDRGTLLLGVGPLAAGRTGVTGCEPGRTGISLGGWWRMGVRVCGPWPLGTGTCQGP